MLNRKRRVTLYLLAPVCLTETGQLLSVVAQYIFLCKHTLPMYFIICTLEDLYCIKCYISFTLKMSIGFLLKFRINYLCCLFETRYTFTIFTQKRFLEIMVELEVNFIVYITTYETDQARRRFYPIKFSSEVTVERNLICIVVKLQIINIGNAGCSTYRKKYKI